MGEVAFVICCVPAHQPLITLRGIHTHLNYIEKMPIIYGIVARGAVVLAEFSNAKGNFDQVTKRILEKIPTEHNSKMSYVYDR